MLKILKGVMNLKISMRLRIKFFILRKRFDKIAKKTVMSVTSAAGIHLHYYGDQVFDYFCKVIGIDSYELAESDVDQILSMSKTELIDVIKTII
jgi:hypothetical protein